MRAFIAILLLAVLSVSQAEYSRESTDMMLGDASFAELDADATLSLAAEMEADQEAESELEHELEDSPAVATAAPTPAPARGGFRSLPRGGRFAGRLAGRFGEEEEEEDVEPRPPMNDWEVATRNADLPRPARRGRRGGRGRRGKAPKLDMEYDSLDWTHIPTTKAPPGALVRLRNAPGAVPAISEDIIPRSLFPRKDCANPNWIAELKVWAKLTQRIKRGKATLLKYKKWSLAARASLKKIALQARATKTNLKTINQAIRGMKYQRQQLVKRLKSYRLKSELDRAQKRMKGLYRYSQHVKAAAERKKAGIPERPPRRRRGNGRFPPRRPVVPPRNNTKPVKPTKPGNNSTKPVKPSKPTTTKPTKPGNVAEGSGNTEGTDVPALPPRRA